MKYILLIWLLCVQLSHSATINCATCSQDDFEAAVYSCASGDTIVLPAGAGTWGQSTRFNQGVIYITQTNLTIQGQGDSTVITLHDTGKTGSSGVIALWANAVFKNIKIVGSNVNPVNAFNLASYNSYTGGFRISNVTLIGGTAGGAFARFTSVTGLIDNCRITGNIGTAELFVGYGPTNAWQSANTLGGADNIFIEDCEFNNLGYVTDANSNARMVVRFCTITGTIKVDGHGIASNTPARSYRNIEVYGNAWTNTSTAAWTAQEFRGGTGMVWNNTSANTQGNAAWFYLRDYGYSATWPNFGNVYQTPANYPIGDQIGTGRDVTINATAMSAKRMYRIATVGTTTFTSFGAGANTVGTQFIATGPATGSGTVTTAPAGTEPFYIWNNTKNGSPWARTLSIIPAGAITEYGSTFIESDVIQKDRDFFASTGFDGTYTFDGSTGIGTGSKASMTAITPTKTGVGYWVTNEGTWNLLNPGFDGQLYQWNGSAWVLYYTPYTYPHPLNNGAIISAANADVVNATGVNIAP